MAVTEAERSFNRLQHDLRALEQAIAILEAMALLARAFGANGMAIGDPTTKLKAMRHRLKEEALKE